MPGASTPRVKAVCFSSSELCITSHTGSTTGQGRSFTINCSGFGQPRVEPAVLDSMLSRKAFHPVISLEVRVQVNISFTTAILDVDEQLQLMTSFLWLEMVWDNPLIRWSPEECEGIRKMSVLARNLWLLDIFIVEFTEKEKTPRGLTAFVSNEGHIQFKKPMKVPSLCNLDIFYFPFDQQNCTLTFCSRLYTADNLILGMEKEVWEMAAASQNIVPVHGEWKLLSITKATPKLSTDTHLHDQIVFYVAIKRRLRFYVLHLLVPSGLLVAIDALSFFLPTENVNLTPFKTALLLAYIVFLLLMNDLLLLPFGGGPLISVYFALCLSLMVTGLLETICITHLLHLSPTPPPPVPHRLHSLLLRRPGPGEAALLHPAHGNQGPGQSRACLPGLKEPGEPEPSGCPESGGARREQEVVELWVRFGHLMDTLLFRLYLLFLASSLVSVIVLWST
ncbi:LOW QUALITY PROTEIN: 5-hydroxytryptamine receptor 3E [Heterocephalus glaber]|uniref:LOW QUALITY PROTEIN: 5-hydroxytryptamine receptor 3E n=1 Tax=Heterocephalus glaber TaxID=10181 RepID=A0AAX6SH50_HETGA|nr:LOW QUALITY PROTEIN: 5-hydroxytryptamine receptor 3E [Heterocephalus glaber]